MQHFTVEDRLDFMDAMPVIGESNGFRELVHSLETDLLSRLPPNPKFSKQEIIRDGLLFCEMSKTHPNLRILVIPHLMERRAYVRIDCLVEE